VDLFDWSMCLSGLNGCNKDLSGFVLSYHSGPDDLIVEVYQMFFYSHRINDILVRKMAPFREMASHAMVAIFPQYVFW